MDNFEKKLFEETDCEKVFHNQGPYWHLSTSGRDQDVIFMSDEDFEFGLTSAALALIEINGFCKAKIRLIAYAIRENHIHEILAGEERHCIEYFKCRKRRLRRYFSHIGRNIDLSNFNCSLQRLENLEQVRNEILFVNNTDYQEDCLCDFYSRYDAEFEPCYTSGRFYFQSAPISEDRLVSINSMSFVQRRDITKSDSYIYPDWYTVYDNQLYPPSFCDFKHGEQLFSSANHYYEKLYPKESLSTSYGLTRKHSIWDIFKKNLSFPWQTVG